MGRKDKDIELLARGVIIRNGSILLAHSLGAGNTYLPGGHIEWGEPAKRALERELLEETGLRLRAGKFLGAVEHSFGKGKRRTHEINLIFLVEGRIYYKVVSRETKIEFLWQPLTKLRTVNLQPYPLQLLLPRMFINRIPIWAGTME